MLPSAADGARRLKMTCTCHSRPHAAALRATDLLIRSAAWCPKLLRQLGWSFLPGQLALSKEAFHDRL
jgi:hypothetical protein